MATAPLFAPTPLLDTEPLLVTVPLLATAPLLVTAPLLATAALFNPVAFLAVRTIFFVGPLLGAAFFMTLFFVAVALNCVFVLDVVFVLVLGFARRDVAFLLAVPVRVFLTVAALVDFVVVSFFLIEPTLELAVLLAAFARTIFLLFILVVDFLAVTFFAEADRPFLPLVAWEDSSSSTRACVTRGDAEPVDLAFALTPVAPFLVVIPVFAFTLFSLEIVADFALPNIILGDDDFFPTPDLGAGCFFWCD
ncbi:hypothetical protein [Candidatus Similichlamydia epinepheli]|uniref:hypothetical protein n=1 Tax=Candidatus Similichlamydia epinepheli TaxID=1903953 RepID=UPI000D34F96E|nr:hypothetical protein [Candidatus Similichlamydia epinepheli]